MAGFLELIDNTLGTHFNTPVYDDEAGRKKMVREIDKAASQHKEGKTKVPNRTWSVGNNKAISYTPRLNGHAILIGDKETNYVPQERFADFLSGFKAAVEKGDFDDQIKAALEQEAASSGQSRSGSTGATRNVSPQSALNIGVAAKRRASPPPSWADIRKSYVDGGADPAMVDAAIEKRKAAEKA